jgi:hypothetical protein
MGQIASYLAQCRVRSLAEEVIGSDSHVPPTAEEVEELITYLRSFGLRPVIVGSAAAFYHFGGDASAFRPTVDIDIHVLQQLPRPLEGWRRDPSAPGVESWISPGGGYVDFLVAGEALPNGVVVPSTVQLDASSPSGFPVATANDVILMKLNSTREKDLMDAIAMARRHGLPPKKRLNTQQRENYELVELWLQARPTGSYGE